MAAVCTIMHVRLPPPGDHVALQVLTAHDLDLYVLKV